MNIERINVYQDPRFSRKVLNQHGCFLVNGEPCEIEILSGHEAVIRGAKEEAIPELIDTFRFYTPHITKFYDKNYAVIREFPPVRLLQIALEDIQPSQFYVDEEKVAAVSSFLTCEEDIIIQVLKQGNRYISLDGHTRLYNAVQKGWHTVRAAEEISADYISAFVKEAIKRNIHTPYDLRLLSHDAYETQWNKFCDTFLAEKDA